MLGRCSLTDSIDRQQRVAGFRFILMRQFWLSRQASGNNQALHTGLFWNTILSKQFCCINVKYHSCQWSQWLQNLKHVILQIPVILRMHWLTVYGWWWWWWWWRWWWWITIKIIIIIIIKIIWYYIWYQGHAGCMKPRVYGMNVCHHTCISSMAHTCILFSVAHGISSIAHIRTVCTALIMTTFTSRKRPNDR